MAWQEHLFSDKGFVNIAILSIKLVLSITAALYQTIH